MPNDPLPPDIDPRSGCRLPLPDRDALGPEARKIYDAFADPSRGSLAGLQGPGGIKLHSETAALLGEPLTRYLRFECGLAPRLRELAVLVTARECDSRFEWAAHEGQALKDGVPQATIDVVKHDRALDGLAEEEREIVEFGRELFGKRRVAPETFARLHARYGTAMLMDLVFLMGNYASTAALLTAVDAQVPEGRPLLPPRR